jgi:hypothetical protein
MPVHIDINAVAKKGGNGIDASTCHPFMVKEGI